MTKYGLYKATMGISVWILIVIASGYYAITIKQLDNTTWLLGVMVGHLAAFAMGVVSGSIKINE